MLRPTRPVPTVGAQARVRHFGGAGEPAVVTAVLQGGRLVQVRTEAGETMQFTLSTATAAFTTSVGGPRLELVDSA